MSHNFNELKKIFDDECVVAEQLMEGMPPHRNKYPEAYVVAGLLQGLTVRKGRFVLQEAIRLLEEMGAAHTINADTAYQTIVPFSIFD